jgi:hypothetical protein
MGQKDKAIKHIAIGLLASKHMVDIRNEISSVTDPKAIAFLNDNFRSFTIQRLNISLDLADKKKIGSSIDIQNLDEAMKLANEAYEKYNQVRVMKRQEKEERKNMGEQLEAISNT